MMTITLIRWEASRWQPEDKPRREAAPMRPVPNLQGKDRDMIFDEARLRRSRAQDSRETIVYNQ
jgi:hypothetical protein